jgi:C1A family cysteine protease
MMAARAFSLLAASAVALPSFEEWCNDFGECNFNSDDEMQKRKAIFEEHKAFVEKTNAAQSTYKLALNQFAITTEAELPTGAKPETASPAASMLPALGQPSADLEVAATVDWVSQGYVTPVKNQGQCGSCWAFSTNAVVESAYALATQPNNFIDASEQQLVDCSGGKFGNQGCNGGWPYEAMAYQEGAGVCSTSSYPYTATDGRCQAASCSMLPLSVTGYQQVQANSEAALIAAINSAPVSVTVYANNAFQLYSSGILQAGCTSQINHAVVAAGYGEDYYLIKNSWGSSWGESGYIRIARGTNAFCIVSQQSTVPAVQLTSVQV